ncbi:MAG TPA: O-antigen ligase family protein [Gemmatimonadaceae bacterium]|nr:O-antigen ligase family protein [Gemmatimonadaceae bacterium]
MRRRPRGARTAVALGLSVAVAIGALALLVGVPVRTALVAGVGVLGLGLSAWSAEAGLALLLLAIAGSDRETLFAVSIPFFGGGLKPTDLLLLAVLAGWVVRDARRRRAFPRGAPGGVPQRDRVLLLLLLLVAWSVVASAHGIARGIYYKDALLELRPMLQYLFLLPLLLEYAPGRGWRLARVLLLVGAVAAGRALVLYATGAGEAASYVEGQRVRNVAAELVVMALLIQLALILERHDDRWLLVLLSLLGVAGLAVTLYRSVMLGLAAAVVTVALLARPAVRWRIAIVVPVLVVAAGVVGLLRPGGTGDSGLLALTERAASIGDYDEDVSAQHRFREWTAAAAMVRASPVLGHGTGARVRFYSPMYGDDRWGFWSENTYIHNAYLFTWVKFGAVGMILLFGAVLLTLARAVRAAWRARPGDRRAVLGGLAAALVSALTIGLFGPQFTTDDGVPAAVACIAVIVLLAREREPGARRPRRPPPPRPARVATVEGR